ncbi:MAG: hypothetical protein JWP68_3549 [Modestobacter sp.]|jgi:hypothetical protein|nr:hypothetical protein [Modestobacter sp.]
MTKDPLAPHHSQARDGSLQGGRSSTSPARGGPLTKDPRAPHHSQARDGSLSKDPRAPHHSQARGGPLHGGLR